MVIAGQRQEKLDEVVAARAGLQAMQLDQDDPASLARMAEATRTRFLALDIQVANAGISRVEDMTLDVRTTANLEAVANTDRLGLLRVTTAGRHRSGRCRFARSMCTPLLPSTSCVTRRLPASEQSM